MRAPPLYHRLFWLILCLLLVGQVLLFSATGVLGLERHGSEFYYVMRHSIAVAIGVGLLWGVSRIRYQFWVRASPLGLWAMVGLVAATLFSPFGHSAQGASRWIQTPWISFQPSELAKVCVVVYLAGLLTRHPRLTALQWGPRLLPVGLLLVLTLKQPDMGTTILLCAVMFGMVFLSGLRPLYLGGLLIGAGGALAYTLMQSDYRRRRILAFMDPWQDPQGSGFQTIQSWISFHWGKLTGAGLGNGQSKLFFLPEVHTDFIFALVGEELGFIGAVALLGLFALLAYWLFKASLGAPDSLGRLLGFGLALSLILQISVNLGGVTGLLPIKGLPLPFLSWGRSALLVNLFAMGILLNIVRQAGIVQTRGSGNVHA